VRLDALPGSASLNVIMEAAKNYDNNGLA